MKNLNDVIVERICKFLGEKDLNQYQLSKNSGIPYPTIKSIMQKRTKGIAFKTIILLAKGFGVSVNEFVGELDTENLDLD